MADRSCRSRLPSRHTVVATGSTPLAGFGLGTVLAPAEIADYRPVRVSSQAYAPAPAEFVVDALPARGVRGTGWRAEASAPQWIEVGLETGCRVDVNGAPFGCRSACEPLHVQADPVKWQVIAVNHTRTAVQRATVTAETYDLSGRRIASTRQARVDVDPAASASAFTAAPGDDLPDLHLLRLTLTDDRGQALSRNTYWRCRTPEALRALNQVQQARLSASLTQVSRDGDRPTATATVRNRGSMVAAMVRLSLLGEDGARVLPARYDDNYLWLLPGETRTVTLSWLASARPSGRPKLRVEGYNTPPVTVHC